MSVNPYTSIPITLQGHLPNPKSPWGISLDLFKRAKQSPKNATKTYAMERFLEIKKK